MSRRDARASVAYLNYIAPRSSNDYYAPRIPMHACLNDFWHVYRE